MLKYYIKHMQFSDGMPDTKSTSAKSEAMSLAEGLSASRFNMNYGGLKIIYTETEKPYDDYRIMRFGIEFLPSEYLPHSERVSSEGCTSLPGYVVTLSNNRSSGSHSSSRYTEAQVWMQKEPGSTDHLPTYAHPVTFDIKMEQSNIRSIGVEIEKTDPYFSKILNDDTKEQTIAHKLSLLVNIADRMRTLYIEDLQTAGAMDIVLVSKKLELLDNIAHAAMDGMEQALKLEQMKRKE